MKHSLLAVMVAVALAGCTASAPTHSPQSSAIGGPAAAATLAFGSHKGEIKRESRLNVADGSRSEVYAIALEKDQRIDVQVRGALDSRISVLRDGYLLASSQVGGDNGWCDNPSPQPPLTKQARLVFQADKTDVYDIAVSGTGPYAFGPFELDVATLGASPVSTALSVDAPATSHMASGQSQDFTLAIEAAGLYAIEMNSCDFDGMLKLSGAGLNLSDDDGAGSLDPRIVSWLEPGQYTVQALAVDGPFQGAYDIHVARQILPAGVSLQLDGEIKLGQTITGLLHDGTEVTYQFTLPRPTRIHLTLRSEAFDALLAVEGQHDYWEDDDSGDGAQGTDALISELLPAGTYTVYVEAYGSGQGLFTLTLETAGRSL